MTRSNLKAVIFVLLAIACNHVHAQTQEPAPENEPTVISHACATPHQPQNLKLASYAPVHSMSATGQTPHLKASAGQSETIRNLDEVPAANNVGMPTTSDAAPGLNTTAGSGSASSAVDPSEKAESSCGDLCDDDARQPAHRYCYPWAVNFGFNMLAPLSSEELRIPQLHDDQAMASKKLPELGSLPESETVVQTETKTDVEANGPQKAGVVMNFSSVQGAQFRQDDAQDGEQIETAHADTKEESSTKVAEYRSGDVFNFSDSEATSLAESAIDPTHVTPLPNLSTEIDSVIEPTIPSGIIVHPPLIQPYNRNQHTFVVENRSNQESKDVTVEIAVPEYAKVIATLPENSVFSKNKALFKFEKIAAGDKIQVHINAISTSEQPVEFVAHVVARNVFEFATEQSAAGNLMDVSYGVDQDEPPQRVTQKLDNGAQRVRNPYINSNSQPVYR